MEAFAAFFRSINKKAQQKWHVSGIEPGQGLLGRRGGAASHVAIIMPIEVCKWPTFQPCVYSDRHYPVQDTVFAMQEQTPRAESTCVVRDFLIRKRRPAVTSVTLHGDAVSNLREALQGRLSGGNVAVRGRCGVGYEATC